MKFRLLQSVALILAPMGAMAADGMPELSGTWVSQSCELRPQPGPDGVQAWYLTREVVFDGNRIDAHFTTYADATCSAPMLDLKFGGPVEVLGDSAVARGAKEVNLYATDYLRITPRMDGFRDYLNSAEAGTCGSAAWETGGEQDVYATGCSVMGVAPNAETVEYEVLYVDAGQLYFGARPVDGVSLDDPDKRPTALQIPLKLKEGGMTRKVGVDDLRVPQVVETATFTQRPDADPTKVRALFENITTRMNKNDTLLYRTVAQGEGGVWFLANYWTSREDMETLNAEAQSWSDDFAAMAALLDLSTFQLSSYDLGN